MQDLSFNVIRSALCGAGGRLATLGVGLFITPYLLSRLGPERFGIWALAGVVTGFIGILDLSFRASVVKYLAESQALGDGQAVRSILSTGFFLYLAVSVTVALGLTMGRNLLLSLLQIPPDLSSEALWVFLLGAVSYLLGLVCAVFPAVCDARQRMDITNSLGVLSLFVGAFLTVLAVEMGTGLAGVALAQLVGVMAFHGASIVAARSMIGPLGLSIRRVGRTWLRKLLSFGFTLHISALCGIVNRQLDKFLLTRWAGLNFVSSYEISLRLVANAGSFQPFLAAVLLPASSHLTATGEHGRLVALYQKASRYLFLTGIPPFVFLAVHSETVMMAWLGRPDKTASAVLLLLAGGYMVNALSHAMAYFCQGMGRPGIQAEQSALQLLANVVLSLVLLRALGPLGAPLGTSLALLLGAFVLALRFHSHLGVSILGLLRDAAAVPFLASFFAVFVSWLVTQGPASSSRAHALLRLLLAGVAFGSIFLISCRLGGYLRPPERAWIRSLLKARKGPIEP